jgi:hypothetical protein
MQNKALWSVQLATRQIYLQHNIYLKHLTIYMTTAFWRTKAVSHKQCIYGLIGNFIYTRHLVNLLFPLELKGSEPVKFQEKSTLSVAL